MSGNPLVVNVAELLRRPGTQKHVELDVEVEGIDNGACRVAPGDRARLDFTLESLPDGIVASGRVTARWSGQCARCVADISGTISADVRELFVEHPDPEGETFPIALEQIDLTPLVIEGLLLELDPAPLCRPDCAGLCPICGTDWNQATCDCKQVTGDPRWSALDQLRFDQ